MAKGSMAGSVIRRSINRRRHAIGAAGFDLALRHREDRAAQYFGRVGALHESQARQMPAIRPLMSMRS